MTRRLVIFALLGALVFGAAACAQPESQRDTHGEGDTAETSKTNPASPPGETATPGGDTSPDAGQQEAAADALVNERCTVCHDRARIDRAKKDRAGWESTVKRMRERGARVNDEEAEVIVNFLANRDEAR